MSDTDREKQVERARRLQDEIEELLKRKAPGKGAAADKPRNPRDFIHDKMEEILRDTSDDADASPDEK